MEVGGNKMHTHVKKYVRKNAVVVSLHTRNEYPKKIEISCRFLTKRNLQIDNLGLLFYRRYLHVQGKFDCGLYTVWGVDKPWEST